MVGQPAFEVARGVLMQVYGYTADEAFGAICDVARRTESSPDALIARLLAQRTPTGVWEIMTPA
jgi:hypothetical protein